MTSNPLCKSWRELSLKTFIKENKQPTEECRSWSVSTDVFAQLRRSNIIFSYQYSISEILKCFFTTSNYDNDKQIKCTFQERRFSKCYFVEDASLEKFWLHFKGRSTPPRVITSQLFIADPDKEKLESESAADTSTSPEIMTSIGPTLDRLWSYHCSLTKVCIWCIYWCKKNEKIVL